MIIFNKHFFFQFKNVFRKKMSKNSEYLWKKRCLKKNLKILQINWKLKSRKTNVFHLKKNQLTKNVYLICSYNKKAAWKSSIVITMWKMPSISLANHALQTRWSTNTIQLETTLISKNIFREKNAKNRKRDRKSIENFQSHFNRRRPFIITATLFFVINAIPFIFFT